MPQLQLLPLLLLLLLLQALALALPSQIPTRSTTRLPNPFIFADGRTVATAAEWTCRQQEILYIFEQYELGDLPPASDSLTASLSNTTLSISVTAAGRSATFTVAIRRGSGSGSGPSPAIIAMGNALVPFDSRISLLTFNNSAFAAQNGSGSRGEGIFYNIFGSGHSAGALTAWAWGVSRIIDALEKLGPQASGIDATRLGVTGCSRNGKGAFVAGALDRRIALTIPQESGAGGSASWRISDRLKAGGANIQTADQIVGENVWFSTRFNSHVHAITSTPYDHHFLAGLVAPRGLYIPENSIDWLGPVSMTGAMRAARHIYTALGVSENMGFSLVGGHGHCQFPSSQNAEIAQFIDYFLLGGTTKPRVIDRSDVTVDLDQWVDWTAPTLS
ncbi:hypothetical protein B0I35DRAFT_475588 [Stachybotrys elegans]|uniref:(4-O-methyl)-D-glucuronate--lignin esterase n=1 Tax=Stachybotrys elegans TaxID=80388 RepID=A0A8K0WVD4_9HYPO|nr:hypothetical protein B0I35DRAFT_475588 [Stachybotrys elegans]